MKCLNELSQNTKLVTPWKKGTAVYYGYNFLEYKYTKM